jgi:hypothetical protein
VPRKSTLTFGISSPNRQPPKQHRYGAPLAKPAAGINIRREKLHSKAEKDREERQKKREEDAAAFRDREAQRESERKSEREQREVRRREMLSKERARRNELEEDRLAEQVGRASPRQPTTHIRSRKIVFYCEPFLPLPPSCDCGILDL